MIYVVQPEIGGPVKIGYTRCATEADVSRRIAGLQTGCPWRLKLLCALDGTRFDEAQLHHRFAKQRSHGEWFRVEGELVEWLRSMNTYESFGPSVPLPSDVAWIGAGS